MNILNKFKIKQMIAKKKLIGKNYTMITQEIKQIIMHNKFKMILKNLFTYKIKQVIQRQIIANNKIKVKMNNLIYKTNKIQRIMLQKIFIHNQMTLKINKIIRIINQKIKQKDMDNNYMMKIKKSIM